MVVAKRTLSVSTTVSMARLLRHLDSGVPESMKNAACTRNLALGQRNWFFAHRVSAKRRYHIGTLILAADLTHGD